MTLSEMLAASVDRHDNAIHTAYAYGTRTTGAAWDSELWGARCAEIDEARKELDAVLVKVRGVRK